MNQTITVILKGLAMGAADIIPGVSGGTVAFITGIYERLLAALAAIVSTSTMYLFKGQVSIFWKAIDGTFLVALFSGILLAIFSLSSVITFLLQSWPHLVWALFFGLILASIWHIGRQVRQWKLGTVVGFVLGCLAAYLITMSQLTQLAPTAVNFFWGGFVAISAMILPGVSGSFILLLLGLYEPALQAIKSFDLSVMSVFALGCFAGLLVMSKVLHWAFKRYHDVTLAVLTGFMLGAMNKLWPWKETVSWRTNSHGEQVAFEQVSVSPDRFELVTGQSSDLILAITMAVLGASVVLVIDYLGSNRR